MTYLIPRMTMKIKKPSKRTLFIWSLILTVVYGIVISASIAYADSMDNMIPNDQSTDTLYNRYSASHYSFETVTPDRQFWQIGAKANDSASRVFDQFLSGAFLIGVQLTRFFNFITREAFTFSFMNNLIDAAAAMIQSISGIDSGTIGSGLWSSIFGVFASFTVLYILWQFVRLRFLDSLQSIVSFILALVVAFAFFTQAGTFLKFLNNTASDFSSTMYAGLAKPGGLSTSTATGVQQISDQVWMELVMKPYGMLQFDDAAAYENHPLQVEQVLKTNPFSDEREKALKTVQPIFPAVSDVRADEQMIILLFAGIFGVTILGFLSFWAMATIYMRLKLLIHAIVMSITLLASLIPGREASIAVTRGQFLKLTGYAVSTVFTMFFLDLSLVAGHVVYNIVAVKANAGWMTGMLLEAAVIFVIFKYREEIGAVFAKAAGNMPMPAKTKSTVVDAIQRNVTRSLYNKGMASISGMFNKQETEGVPSSFNPNSLSKAGDSLNDATTASMQLRYQREKDAAEQLAADTGQPVQYTPYVTQVNENMRTGTKNPFRGMDKAWKEEKTRLSDIKQDGGDVRQAILSQGVMDDMNDQQVAATMYANENAIRQASMLMVNRPKASVSQLRRAGVLNKNRKLETSVNDFVMVELFQRYKVEYKQAIDTSIATEEPVQHTQFVKDMNERFKAEGLFSTNQINETITTRTGRIAHANSFLSMPAFIEKKQDLLRANEAFQKATGTIEGVQLPAAPIQAVAPMNPMMMLNKISGITIKPQIPAAPTSTAPRSTTASPVISVVQIKSAESHTGTPFVPKSTASIIRGVPPLQTRDQEVVTQDLELLMKPRIDTKVDLSQVKIPDNVRQQIQAANNKINYHLARTNLAESISVATSSNMDHRHIARVKLSVDGKLNSMPPQVDRNNVSLAKELQHSIEAAQTKLKQGTKIEVGDRLEVDIEKNIQIFSTHKQRLSHDVSNDLSKLDQELKIMQKANGNRLVQAPVNESTNTIIKKNARKAQETRMKAQRPTV